MERSWSRRSFVASTAGAFGSGWLALNWPAIAKAAEHAHELAARTVDAPAHFATLSAADARDIESFAEQIIPTTTTAGARAAGVVYFIDRALGTFFAGHAEEFAAGLEEFAARIQKEHGATARFADLEPATQLDAVRRIDGTPFFEAMRTLTVLGFLASPSYGGNHGATGWQAVGFTDQHTFEPPFGYYDRDYAGFEPYPRSDEGDPT